jgi:membrane protein implicated in regulation of membrane protease activity
MTVPDLFLLCLLVGSLWALASFLMGGMHSGGGHGHVGHVGHTGASHGHAGFKAGHSHATSGAGRLLGSMVNPSCAAIFLAWFGGIGYLLTRHSGLAFWLDLVIAVAAGLGGASILGSFLRFLQAREQPLNPADYEMIGVLARVSSPIRVGGVGELIYVRDGGRKAVPACSEDGAEIERDHEVVVTRFEQGIAWVRTFEAMTREQH